MPRLHSFGRCEVWMYYGDHNPPHFHVNAPDFQARVRITDLAIMSGTIPPRYRRRVLDWAAENQAHLRDKWEQFSGQ